MTKFCEQVCDDLVSAFSMGADVKTACKAAGITATTYHAWILDPNKVDFSKCIARAKAEFRRSCPDELVRLAKSRLADALQPDRRHIRKMTSTRTTIFYDENDEITGRSVTEEEKIFDELLPTPLWAIERVLPKTPLTFEDLTQIAEKYGCRLEVVNPDAYRAAVTGVEIDSQDSQAAGLSESTAAAIRAQIMGFPENSLDSAAQSD